MHLQTIFFRTSTVAIKRRSRVPGVMITQFVDEIPEGMSTPDFTRKPIALTIQEGKLAFFKSMVSGVPKPNITWARNKGPLEDPVKYISRYDEIMEEYFLEIPNVTAEQADTYKCFAANEYGRAVCTATLNVIEGEKLIDLCPKRAAPEDFRKMLKRKVVRTKPPLKKKEGEIDPKFWEVLLSSPKKDYENVCMEYGVTDFRNQFTDYYTLWVVEKLENLKHIEVKADGSAEFELDIELKNPNSQVFLFKDGVMVPYSDDGSGKHNLNKIGKKYIFSINDLMPDDAGLYQVDVEDANCFSTDFKIIPVEFVVKIQEVKAKEREDAVFECVLSHPFPKIVWIGKKIPLEQGDKFDITVSEDHLIHSLKVKDCAQVDKGVYTAMAGIASCNAWLIVEADNDPNTRGKKTSHKFMLDMPDVKGLDLQCPPSFLLPLKIRTAPPGYECYMSCAVRGDPKPHVTWYHNNVSLNTNTNYLITNVCGVCTILILKIGPKDSGDYSVIADSPLGRAECSTKLTVRGSIAQSHHNQMLFFITGTICNYRNNL
uniref:Immunoglobulin like and fibronectin type III domain containing 1, tandem duplicate 2 n=1 Tax=Hucho hucho TaxID=62062 RepID=A0A4W5R221_9TELE